MSLLASKKLFGAIVAHETVAAGIEATIRSITPLVEKVFVFDANSGTTAEIAEKLGALVIKGEWKDDFSAARNELMEYIESEIGLKEDSKGSVGHVFWIEPGELFDKRTERLFRGFCEQGIDPVTAYFLVVRRAIPEEGETLEKSMETPDNMRTSGRSDREEEIIESRLIPLGYKIRFSGRVRETALNSLQEKAIELSAAPGRILRLSPLLEHEERERRAKLSLKIIAEAEKNGETLSDDMQLERAEAMYHLGAPAAARELYRQLAEKSDAGNVILESFYRIDDTYRMERNKGLEPIESLTEGLKAFPNDLQLLSLLGNLLQEQRQSEVAIRTFETAVKHGRIAFDVWHRWRIRSTAVRNLGLLYRMNGEADKAIKLFEENLEKTGNDNEILRCLLDMYILNGDAESGRRLAERLWDGPKLEKMQNVVSGAALAAKGDWSGAIGPLSEAYQAGLNEIICLRWYSLVLLSSIRLDDAKPVLHRWKEIEPRNIEPRAFLFAIRYPDRFSEVLNKIGGADLSSLETEIERPGFLPDSLESLWEKIVDGKEPKSDDLAEIDVQLQGEEDGPGEIRTRKRG